jgi:hypothetical protein
MLPEDDSVTKEMEETKSGDVANEKYRAVNIHRVAKP